MNSAVPFSHSFVVGRGVVNLGRRLVLLSNSVPLACLVVALLEPASAHAGCDYPTHIERTPADLLSPKPDSRSPTKPCGCTGPTCSRPPLVPPASSWVESVKILQWGLPLARFVHLPSPVEAHGSNEPPFLPSRHPSSIYRPPRLPI